MPSSYIEVLLISTALTEQKKPTHQAGSSFKDRMSKAAIRRLAYPYPIFAKNGLSVRLR